MKNTIWFFSFETLGRMHKNIFFFFQLFFVFLEVLTKTGYFNIGFVFFFKWQKKQTKIKQNSVKQYTRGNHKILNIHFFLLDRTRPTIVGLDRTQPKIHGLGSASPQQLVTVHEHSNQLHLTCRDVHRARPAWRGRKQKQKGRRVYLEKPRSLVMASGGGGSRRRRCWWQLMVSSPLSSPVFLSVFFVFVFVFFLFFLPFFLFGSFFFFLSVFPPSPFFCSLPYIYRWKQGRDMVGAATVQLLHDYPRGTFPPFFTAPW